MQAPTNGFFYVLDRVTGKLISAEKIGKATWADHIDLKTGRPVERPNIRPGWGTRDIGVAQAHGDSGYGSAVLSKSSVDATVATYRVPAFRT